MTKVSRCDIAPVMQTIYQGLETLQHKISDQISSVNDDDLSQLVEQLKKSVHQLNREINQSVTVLPFEGNVLLKLIETIQRTSTFAQAVGPHQVQLMGLFKTLQTNIPKAEQKVAKVDNDPIRR